MQHEWVQVISVGVHVYILAIYFFSKNNLELYFTVNSAFQVFVVDFLSNLYTSSTTVNSRNAFLID